VVDVELALGRDVDRRRAAPPPFPCQDGHGSSLLRCHVAASILAIRGERDERAQNRVAGSGLDAGVASRTAPSAGRAKTASGSWRERRWPRPTAVSDHGANAIARVDGLLQRDECVAPALVAAAACPGCRLKSE
jgi:hypothetical protein